LVARLLADQHQLRPIGAFPEHRLGGVAVEITALARSRGLPELFDALGLRRRLGHAQETRSRRRNGNNKGVWQREISSRFWLTPAEAQPASTWSRRPGRAGPLRCAARAPASRSASSRATAA